MVAAHGVPSSEALHISPWSRLRPGFSAITLTVALVTPPSFAVLARRHHSPAAAQAAVLQAVEERTVSELRRLGWTRMPSGAGTGSVAFFRAERDFVLAVAPAPVRGRPPTAARLERVQHLVAAELDRYPRETFPRVGLHRVLFCTDLREQDRQIPSLPNYERTLLVDVDASPSFLRRVVHHELFHFLDYADDQRVGHDPAWERLNDPWFVYGSGGRFMREPGSAQLTERLPGFLSRYSTSAPEEDQAEVFSFMMTAAAAVARVAARDPIVRAKMARVQAKASARVPKLDQTFWHEIAARRR